MKEGVSVIICCYNSEWIIKRTLEALKAQNVSADLSWEIVLVDNNCTDNTIKTAQASMKDASIPFKVIEEKTPGLMNARRAGINAANFNIVIYCDDDNILCPDYLHTMYDIMQSNQQIGAAGGKGIAELGANPSPLVRENLGGYAIGSQMNNDCWLFGAGLTLRTSIVRDIYEHQKCYMTGRKKGLLLSGDDSELVMATVLRGYKIFPTDDVYFTHVLKAERLTIEYYQQLYKGLLLPFPVFTTFRAAIYDRSFSSVLHYYYSNIKNIIMSYIHSDSPDNQLKCYNSKLIIKAFHFWGFLKLWHIYKEWKRIKKQYKHKMPSEDKY